jgi:hypothetical protein
MLNYLIRKTNHLCSQLYLLYIQYLIYNPCLVHPVALAINKKNEPPLFATVFVVIPVPDPLRLRKSGSTGNRTWTSGSVARNAVFSWLLHIDHTGSPANPPSPLLKTLGWSRLCMKLTNHIQLVAKSRKCESLRPLSYVLCRHGVV